MSLDTPCYLCMHHHQTMTVFRDEAGAAGCGAEKDRELWEQGLERKWDDVVEACGVEPLIIPQ